VFGEKEPENTVVSQVPKSCLWKFLRAGWYPGRRAWFTRFDGLESLASCKLGTALTREFGGLHVGRTGPGRDHAVSDIYFYRRPSAEHRYAVKTIEQAGDDLFPLGEAHEGHMELFLDARGRLVVYGVPDGSLAVVGESFGEGVERLLLGYTWPEQRAAEQCAGADRPRE
jgi:hypothetical protein